MRGSVAVVVNSVRKCVKFIYSRIGCVVVQEDVWCVDDNVGYGFVVAVNNILINFGR